MKVLLITIAIGESYLKHYETIFKPSHERYAAKHGYDFKVISHFLDEQIQDKSTISFNKILVCRLENAEQYDFIVCIDADIFISSSAPAIHDSQDFHGQIGIANEYTQPSSARRIQLNRLMGWEKSASHYYEKSGFSIQTDRVLNTGVLVLQPRLHKNFLETIYDTYIQKAINHPRGFHYEQSCIGYELQKHAKWIPISTKFNAIWPLQKFDNREGISLEDFCKANYFIHFTGSMDHERIKLFASNT